MSAASPTPMGPGSHFTSLGRRTSARQAVRRPASRSQLGRNESNAVGSSASAASAAGRDSKSQSQQYSTLNDSSDDEMPVPMKLSALTKALLNDGHASEASSTAGPAAADRPQSPPARPPSRVMTRRNALATSTSSAPEEKEARRESTRQRETRRHARAGSVQLPSSRPSSPVRSREPSPAPPRKRVVRLSATTPANGGLQGGLQGAVQGGFHNGLRRSLSSSTQGKRPEIKELPEEKKIPAPVQTEQAPQKEVSADVNTPVVPVRTVRIAVGSSGHKGRSGSSSGVSSKRSAGHSDPEMPEDPATIGRPTVVAPQSSMRVKRVGNAPGSFLSGPARRGRRRQSEEDAEGQGEGDGMGSSQEPESQQPQYMESAIGEQPASSFFASSYRDFAASGSPVSAKDSARAALRKQALNTDIPESDLKDFENGHLPLAYKIMAPPELPSAHDKENEMPSAFRRSKPGSAILVDKELVKPPPPLHVDLGQPQHHSPERKALAPKSQNTPRRPAPPPPPKMSVVETATAAAGASTTGQANKKRQIMLRVNNRTYTRIDCIGRGGSGKVYRVSAESGKMLALKRVSLENADENTVKGFKGEIDLLKRLAGVDRVIQLIDHELNIEKQMLSVVSLLRAQPLTY